MARPPRNGDFSMRTTLHPASAASIAAVSPAMPPPITRRLFLLSGAVLPLIISATVLFHLKGRYFSSTLQRAMNRYFQPHRLLIEEAEQQPFHGKNQQLLVIAANRFQAPLIHVKELAEASLKHEAPEAIEVVTGHQVHFELGRLQRLTSLPEFIAHQFLERFAHHLEHVDCLARNPVAN